MADGTARDTASGTPFGTLSGTASGTLSGTASDRVGIPAGTPPAPAGAAQVTPVTMRGPRPVRAMFFQHRNGAARPGTDHLSGWRNW